MSMRKKLLIFLLIMIMGILLSGTVSATSNSTLTSDQQSQVMNAQIPFVENNGQTDSSVIFYADTFYGTAFVTNNSIVHSIQGPENTTLVVKEEFLDGNGQVINFQATGVEQGTAKVDFYIGNDSSQWQTSINTWNIISLGELYPGITVLLRVSGDNMEKIFQIAPGANPELIKIRVTGADAITIDEDGNLNLQSIAGDVQLTKPIAYQEDLNIDVAYLLSDNIYRFTTGPYNQLEPLTIDPTLKYSSYIGGMNGEYGSSIAVDGSGNVYITGSTSSSNFPTTIGAYQTTADGGVLCSKLALNGLGSADLLYSTFLGGSSYESGEGIAVDASGNIYITGYTSSSDFPVTSGAFQITFGGNDDVFLVKLAPNGEGTNDLLYSTFLGRASYEYVFGIALGYSGDVYITGQTQSNNFPTTVGAYQTTYQGGWDVFVTIITPNGLGSADLLYSTFLGGTGDNISNDIKVDNDGNIYITGRTTPNFPVTIGAYQTTAHAYYNAFVTVIAPNGEGTNDLLYSTFLGGSSYETGEGIFIDSSRNIYITGYTDSSDFPSTTGAYQTTYHGNRDVFVTIIDPKGEGTNDLLYSTFLGGTGSDHGYGMDVDIGGDVYITGCTDSTDFPITVDAIQTTFAGPQTDSFLVKLAPNGDGLQDLKYSTYLGGTYSDRGEGIAVDSRGNVYIIGYTYSSDFPTTTRAYQTTFHGDSDVFVVNLYLPLLDVYPGNSIQESINMATDGDIIVVHGDNGNPAIYTENLTLNKKIIIVTAGDGIVTVNAQNGSYPVFTINENGSGSTIQGFSITGASSSFGIYLNMVNNCKITGNKLSDNFMGIYIQNSSNNTISDNKIQNNGWVGLCLDNSNINTINYGNEIRGNIEGIYIVNNSNGNTIIGNEVNNNSNTGINILNNSSANIIGNNDISQNSVIGVLIRDSNINTINGNNIQSNGWAGIALDNADNNIINDANIISGNLEGLNIIQSTGNSIQGNTITNNTNIGISIINGSIGNIISSNTAISNNGIIGIYLRDSDTNTIFGNSVQNNVWVGICLDNAPNNIINGKNYINGNLEGLYLVNDSNNNIIINNYIQNNFDTGIFIDSSYGNNITYNYAISDNGVIGILFRNANNNIISYNSFVGNTFAGIALDNADNNDINRENSISNSQMGIYVVNGSNGNTINNNKLQENTWAGIILDGATNTTIYQNNFINNPLQALAQNGSSNAFYKGDIGNYWSDWSSNEIRPIDGSEGLFDEYPSTTPL